MIDREARAAGFAPIRDSPGALREARARAAHALAAPMAWVIARMALAALGLSGDPVHEPVHVRGPESPPSCYSA